MVAELLHERDVTDCCCTATCPHHRSTRIETGPLVVDLRRCLVTLDGLPVPLTPTEYWIVAALAQRMDRCVPASILARTVWGVGSDGPTEIHMLRVNLARVRSKFGCAAGLIVTQLGLGYRLLRVEPGAAVPPAVPLWAPIAGRWSLRYAHCRNCGTTERAHHGQGYCAPCYRRLVRGSWRTP